MIRRTPLVVGRPPLDDVAFKLENLQATGSFKLRGAWRAVAALSPEARGRGLICASAGNHGAGLAIAARAAGASLMVFMPATVPDVKRVAIAALGARIALVGAAFDEADAAARTRAAEAGLTFVSPFDDDEIIAGNGGSLGRELAEQVAEPTHGLPPLARVVVPVGGGGLFGGLAAELGPRGVDVVGVQPAANRAMYDSLAAGRAFTAYRGRPTLAEGCEGAVAERTYRLAVAHGAGIALVDEAAIRRAMAWAYRELGQILEPTGAVALAGLLSGALPSSTPRGLTVCVLTGGNADPALLDAVLSEYS